MRNNLGPEETQLFTPVSAELTMDTTEITQNVLVIKGFKKID